MRNLHIAWQLFVDPESALAALGERPRFWFPLLVVAGTTAMVTLWYFNVVDYQWLAEGLASGNARLQEMSEADRAKATAYMTKSFLVWASLAGILLGTPALRLLESTYYLLAARATHDRHSFAQWFALACWTNLPALVGTLSLAMYLLLHGGGQVSVDETQLLSLNELLFHVPAGDRWHGLLSSLTILQPWMWWLSALGVRLWTRRSFAFSAAFVMLPVALFYCSWAAYVSLGA